MNRGSDDDTYIHALIHVVHVQHAVHHAHAQKSHRRGEMREGGEDTESFL